MNEAVIISWLGHACFKITGGGYSIVLDPYTDDYVPGFGAVRTTASEVLCSHGHRDHSSREAVTLEPFSGLSPWLVSTVDSYHDEQQGALRGANRIHILEYGGQRIVHMGDQGCLLTEEQLARIGRPDVLLLPIGGFYTIDAITAKTIADQLHARIIIPMHYRSERFGFDVVATLDDFADSYDMVVYYDSDSIEVGPDTEEQVAVLERWNETQQG